LFVLVLSGILTVWQERLQFNAPVTLQALSLLGVALGIFLGFRNNAAYDRFWEGRKLWGRLLNVSRALSRNLLAYLPLEATSDTVQVPAYRIIAFAHALRMQLREQMDVDALAPFVPASDLPVLAKARNVPNVVLLQLGRDLQALHRRGLVGEQASVELSRQLFDLSDIQGGCERIKNSPIPHTYTVLIHQIVALYVVTLPFGLVGTLHHLTPIVVLFVAYTFLGLDAVGDEIEEPFGEDLNDLPLSSICRNIEINVRETLGEAELPPLWAPKNGVVS